MLPSVAVINYDFLNTTPQELIGLVQGLLGGRPPLQSLAVAAPGFLAGKVGLLPQAPTTAEDLKVCVRGIELISLVS